MRLIIPWVFLSSIFVGVGFNFLLFIYPEIIDYFGTWFISDIRFSDLLAITFIIFTFILLITVKFIDKIAHRSTLIICVIITGFSLIYTSFAWNWQIYFMNFLLTGVGIGFIVPIIIRLMNRVLPSDQSKIQYSIFFLLTIVIWVISFGFIFTQIGAKFWRLLFIVVGSINIFSSFLILNLEEHIDAREIEYN